MPSRTHEKDATELRALTAKALAKAVADGDIVNFRLLFEPFAPSRVTSTERFGTAKYAYLLPDEEEEAGEAYGEALSLVEDEGVWSEIGDVLEDRAPRRLPWAPLLRLADRAVVLGKYTAAAQAYELLRIRERMRAMLLDHSDAFLDKGELKRAAGGYRAAAGLEYDYSAYPEPLPSVPDYAKRALVLHADYPQRPEDCVSLGETPRFVQSALSYLLLSGELAERLADRPLETKVALAVELVRRIDPDWDAFAERYRKAAAMTAAVADRFRAASERGRRAESLSEIIAEEFGDDPSAIPAALLGRSIENGQWWQYVKELAVTHPAGALFVARQDVNDHEIIVPRRRGDDPLSKALGLARTGDESAEATDAIGTDRL